MRLLWAGSMAIFAAAIGFAIRGGIFGNWAADFGFTGAQLGAIGGAGFIGFCFGIIIGGVVVDRVGYGKLVVAAFVFHILSAVVALAATKGQAQETAYAFLWWGMFLFAIANGTLEAVANPLVATLFPNNRTHYLNILHASWPAGLVIGSLAGWQLGAKVDWKIQLALFLIPTAIYGVMFLGQRFPKSEAAAKGLSFSEMAKDVGILGSVVVCALLALFFGDVFKLFMPHNVDLARILGAVLGLILLGVMTVVTRFSLGAILLFVLFLTHALVGAVELGTDGWIQNITGNILTPDQGKILFAFTSMIMFVLRFCAHFVEKNLKLSPIGLLLVCSILAVVGLNMVSGITSFAGAMLALSIYAVGKTFFWPTMLAVVGDRFPRTGAVAMSIMGGIGMLSAGLIGSAGLGYAKDRFASEELQKSNAALYEQYKAPTSSQFLFFDAVHGLDGAKLAEIQKLEKDKLTPEQKTVSDAGISGDRRTLQADSAIPALMAVIYLGILAWFASIGGYKPVTIDPERLTGGTTGPMEA